MEIDLTTVCPRPWLLGALALCALSACADEGLLEPEADEATTLSSKKGSAGGDESKAMASFAPANEPFSCEGLEVSEWDRTTGSACPLDTSDGCGEGRKLDDCSWDHHHCRNRLLWQNSSELLNCALEAPLARTQEDVNWQSCETALVDGRSREACGFVGSCARATDDACCIETAGCGLLYQEQVLYRYRICTPGCEKVRANPAMEQVTRCTDGDMMRLLGAPCKAGLVCIANGDPAQTGALHYYNASVVYCANGVLVGNPTGFLPFL